MSSPTQSAIIATSIGLLVAMFAACKSSRQETTVCSCAPGNISHTRMRDGSYMDGNALLERLRRHRNDVAAHKTPRDIKVDDDELRLAIMSYCEPCGDWISDRATVEQMFPLDRLDEAADAVCLGLVLRDGKTAYGEARPPACR
jgi:hypothetical protein